MYKPLQKLLKKLNRPKLINLKLKKGKHQSEDHEALDAKEKILEIGTIDHAEVEKGMTMIDAADIIRNIEEEVVAADLMIEIESIERKIEGDHHQRRKRDLIGIEKVDHLDQVEAVAWIADEKS